MDNIILPVAEDGDCTQVIAKISAPCSIIVEPVGRWFESYWIRRRRKQTLSQHSLHSSSSEDSSDDVSADEEDETYLKTLDPKEWKDQDHYEVLGLKKLRVQATDDQLKRAYKKKVLKHHPDKRKARGLEVDDGDNDYFTCITRAYEVLGDPTRRRAYDSVDPEFDNTVPPISTPSKENFYVTFGSYFTLNARWSNKRKVPDLGTESSTFEEVNHVYSFWYDFDSWREYSYLDEEEKEKGENREERRWIEKQNKAARKERKKEEMTRIRLLVDNAYACDPRIQKFKDEEKEKKQAQKRARQEATKAKADEEEKRKREVEEAERKKKEEEEEIAKAQAAVAKKEKDAQKKLLKKERKTLRTTTKEFDFFTTNETTRVNNMQEVEKLAELLSLTSLQALNSVLTSVDKDKAERAFNEEVEKMNIKLEEEKRQMLMASQKQSDSAAGGNKKFKDWRQEEVQLLIKAVNLFPAGTNNRWEVVGSFITQHLPDSNRTAKEVLNKAKTMQKMDPRQAANEQVAAENLLQTKHSVKSAAPTDEADISSRYMSAAEAQLAETGTNPAPWSTDEQKLLEQALKTYPASTPERWEKIADCLPARSKKDCMLRYKELAELIRKKKLAQAAAAAKTRK